MGLRLRIIIIWVRLIFPNFYVLVGIMPFFAFLSMFSTLIMGVKFEKTKIEKIIYNSAPRWGKYNNNSCYYYVCYKTMAGNLVKHQEKCEYLNELNDVGKSIIVRIDCGTYIKNYPFKNVEGQGAFDSIISVEGRQINSKYDMPWFPLSLSLLGLLMFILWIKNSLIPRIKGTHPLQIALKNRKPEQPSKFNYDKY